MRNEVFLMRRLLIVMVAMAAASTGCATTMTASSYVERGLSFAPYSTYDWGPADALPTGDPRLDKDPFFRDHVEGAVEKALAAKGLERSDATPDLLIHYHASITHQLDVNRLDRQAGFCSGAGCDTGVTEYEAGTLVLDVVDARTKRVIWRGWARDTVEDALADRDRMAGQINEAVTRMMATFPDIR
jgi:hypothetical protein